MWMWKFRFRGIKNSCTEKDYWKEGLFHSQVKTWCNRNSLEFTRVTSPKILSNKGYVACTGHLLWSDQASRGWSGKPTQSHNLWSIACPMCWIKCFLEIGVSIVIMKHDDQKASWKDKVYMTYTSGLLFIIEGSQDKNSNLVGPRSQKLMCRPWRGDACLKVPMTCSACLLNRTQEHQSRGHTSCKGLSLSICH